MQIGKELFFSVVSLFLDSQFHPFMAKYPAFFPIQS